MNSWRIQYLVYVVQAHNGQTAINRYAISGAMVDHMADEIGELLGHVAREMDREMLRLTGHVDRHRLWGADDEGSKRNPHSVYFLDGPIAGMRHNISTALSTFRVLLPITAAFVNMPYAADDVPQIAVYDIHPTPIGRVGIERKGR